MHKKSFFIYLFIFYISESFVPFVANFLIPIELLVLASRSTKYTKNTSIYSAIFYSSEHFVPFVANYLTFIYSSVSFVPFAANYFTLPGLSYSFESSASFLANYLPSAQP
jgi:hypothetical protein